MFFEAVEKKFEATVTGVDLRALGDDFWEEMVRKAKAQVLSKISNSSASAYLLSESTLIVWPHRCTLVTCGKTSLVSSVLLFVDKVKKENIKNIVFERKNEKQPHAQYSSFLDDVREINKETKGEAYSFYSESKEDPQLFLYETEREVNVSEEDVTLEVLNHELSQETRDFLSQCESKEELRKFFGLHEIFKDFKIDDHLFKPFGYSLNALLDEFYYTIHISPQEESSYVSFETNFYPMNFNIVEKIVKALNPEVCEVVLFSKDSKLLVNPIESYFKSNLIEKKLKSNYKFDYLQLRKAKEKKVFLKELR